MPELLVHPLTIEDFIEKIETQKGFSFARYGDGSFFCMQGRKGKNCDGVTYTQEKASSLLLTLRDKNITHAIGPLARSAAHAEEWLEAMNIRVDWYDCDVMNNASDEGRLYPLIACLRKRKNIVCGPSHLVKLACGIPILSFVECHITEAFEEVDELEMEISYRVEKHQPDTVLLSAGTFASPTLVSRLHALYPQLTIIDTGSVWDPYMHVFSRSGHKRQGWDGYKKLGWKNFNLDIEKW